MCIRDSSFSDNTIPDGSGNIQIIPGNLCASDITIDGNDIKTPNVTILVGIEKAPSTCGGGQQFAEQNIQVVGNVALQGGYDANIPSAFGAPFVGTEGNNVLVANNVLTYEHTYNDNAPYIMPLRIHNPNGQSNFLSCNNISVSYTHLDVYKRQL